MKGVGLLWLLLACAVPAFAQTPVEWQAQAMADPSPASLYNAGVAWEQAQEPVRALQFYRQARALGLPEAASAQARVEASLQLPPRATWVLPAFELWALAMGMITLASLLGMLQLLRPRPTIKRLAWALGGVSGFLGGLLLLQGWLLAPGPLVVAAQELRSGPGWAFPTVSQVPAGAEVRQVDHHSGWVLIQFQDQSGWLLQAALLP